jgi:hypothetical protein
MFGIGKIFKRLEALESDVFGAKPSSFWGSLSLDKRISGLETRLHRLERLLDFRVEDTGGSSIHLTGKKRRTLAGEGQLLGDVLPAKDKDIDF